MCVAESGRKQETPQMSPWRLIYPLLMFLPIFILFDDGLRSALGGAAGFLLQPTIGFGGDFPLVTAVLATLFPGLASTVLRHYMVDWIRMARQGHDMGALRKELMEATRKQNPTKIKKIREKQMDMTMKSQQVQMDSMKPTLIMTFFFIMVFAWLGYFISDPSTVSIVAVPWSTSADLNAIYLFPAWVWIYMFVSTPVYMVLGRVLKYFTFSKKLREMGEPV